MLTGMVNFAVFAAFRWCASGILLANPEFKPCRAIWQRDIWRYGRQKWHDRGKKRQRMARSAATTARM
jgi:hypothetical protein